MAPVRYATRCCLLTFSAVLMCSLLATGQEPPPAPAAPLPPDASTSLGGGQSLLLAPDAEAIAAGQPISELAVPFYETENWAESHELWDCEPVPVESTGSWFRRGFWYAEVDAVVLNKHWGRRDVFLATDDLATNADPTPIFGGGGTPASLASTNRVLFLKSRHPGSDAGARFTLGRFLFRDVENRDHTAEFTAFGAGDFVHDCSVSSVVPNQLVVPFAIDATNLSFDGSNQQRVSYTSRFNNFEVNYRVKRRMRKDQMVLDPNGGWYRRANPTITREFLVGLRFFDLTERLNWTAQFVDGNGNVANTGEYLIRTDNNLFGFQLGGGEAYETARWSIGLLGKAGVFLNDAKGRTRFSRTDFAANAFTTRMAEDQISAILESRVIAKWHLRPNFSLRASYEGLYVTSVALATHQITFNPVFSKLATSGDPFFHGASFGFEGYW